MASALLSRWPMGGCLRRASTASTASTAGGLEDCLSPANRDAAIQRAKKLRPWMGRRVSEGAEGGRSFATLVPLCRVDGAPGFLLTRRSALLRSHRREISFPGGEVEPGESVVEAALREAEEEVGLSRADVSVWCPLKPLATKSLKDVAVPVLAEIHPSVDVRALVPNEDEVDEILLCRLDELCQPKVIGHTQFQHSSDGVVGYSLPVFEVGRFRVWGLSAVMLHQALLCLAPNAYRPTLAYVPPVQR